MTALTTLPTRHKERWQRSGPRHTCPICGNKNGKCSWTSTVIACHYTASDRPAAGAVPGWLHYTAASKNSGPYANVTIADLRTRPATTESKAQEPEAEPTATPDDLLHQVYSSLLAALTINPRHYRELTDPAGKRRLSAEEVKALGIKSLPRNTSEVCTKLEKKYGRETLLTVPGFYLRKGSMALAAGEGMLLPSSDGHHITGLRVRPERPAENGPKYFWLSSAKHDGPGPKARASIYQPLKGTTVPNTIGITEGEFKAFIAAQHLGYSFISTPGTAAWQSAGVVELAKAQAQKVIIFYDSELNPHTEHQRNQLADALLRAGLQVDIATWPKAGDQGGAKGIDDLLLAGGEFTARRHVLDMGGVPIDRFMSERFLPDLPITHRVTLIKSPKGSGKTEYISRLLSELPLARSVLSIGHRVALLGEQSRRWKLDFYVDFKGGDKVDRKGLTESARLAICLDSLIHFNRADQKNYIIIDEVEQVLRHLTGNTIKPKRRAVIAMFRALLLRADHVIALDADLSATSYRYFKRLGITPEEIEVIVNEWQRPDGPPMLSYEDKHELTAVLLKQARAGVKCYVATNSREEARRLERIIEKELPQLRQICITQENSADPEVRRIIGNLNLHAPGYDLLIASPTLGTGIDINIDHFTETFVIGTHQSSNHKDLLQHMARNRRAARVHAFIAPGERYQPTEPEYWQQHCVRNYRETGLEIDYAKETGERIASPMDRDYLHLWSEIKAADVASHNQLALNFFDQAEREGFKVREAHQVEAAADPVEVSAEEITEAGQARIEAREELEEERIEAILEAPDITDEEAGKLARKSYLPKAGRARLERHRLQRFYNLPVDRELIEIDDKGRTMQRLNEFMMYVNMIDSVESDRKIFDDAEKLLPDARHYTLRRNLRQEIIERAGISMQDPFNNEQLHANGFVQWVLENKERIFRVLATTVKKDFEEKPIELLSIIFKQLHIKLKCRRVGGRAIRERVYSVDLESVETMQRLARARLQAIEQRRTEAVEVAA